MPAVLRIKDAQGKVYTVPALRGEKGKDGTDVKAGKHILLGENGEISVDTAETLDISDARPAAGSAVAGAIADVRADIPKTKLGTYTGNGAFGALSPNTVDCGFAPKLFVVAESTPGGKWSLWLGGLSAMLCGAGENATVCSVSDGRVSFYSETSAEAQYNGENVGYTYFAIG